MVGWTGHQTYSTDIELGHLNHVSNVNDRGPPASPIIEVFVRVGVGEATGAANPRDRVALSRVALQTFYKTPHETPHEIHCLLSDKV